MKTFLETKRLLIKPPSLDEIEMIYILDSDPDVMRYIGDGKPRAKADSKKWYEKSIKHFEKYGFSFGLVYEKETGEFVGRAGINYNAYDDSQSDIEIGYRLHKKFWNKGYATELATALIQWGFQNLKLEKICGFAHPDNQASRHVLEKIGMHLIGLDKYADEEIVRYEISKNDLKKAKKMHHCQYIMLKKNMQNIHGEIGKKWISDLPMLVDEVSNLWKLKNIQPVDNMSFHFVAKAVTESNQPVVLKIGLDKKVIESEMRALAFFNGQGAICLIDYLNDYNAMLLQQAIPGVSLKSIYPAQCDFVIETYVKTINNLHKKHLPSNLEFPHIREWLVAIDQVNKDRISQNILKKSIELKNNLLNTSKHEILLHGDLHHDNILQNGNEWIVIDPKGVIGEAEFEIAAFDFIHSSELENKNVRELFEKRVDLIAQKSNLDAQRIKDWVFIRLILSAAWSIEDNSDPSWAIKLSQKIL